MSAAKSSPGMPAAAARLFIRREYAAIKGQRSSVFWALYAILLCSLLAIVFGKAALDHLHERMEDPFTTTISIPVQNGRYQDRYAHIKAYLDSCAATGAFGVEASSGDRTASWRVFSPSARQDLFVYVRSFSFGHDRALLERIVGPGNLVADLSGRLDAPETYTDGVIIGLPLLDDLGLDTADLRGRKLLVSTGLFTFPLRVVAITRTLPERAKLCCDHALLRALEDHGTEGSIATDDVDEVTVLLSTDEKELGANAGKWEPQLRGIIREARDIRIASASDMATHRVKAVITLERALTFEDGPGYFQEKLNEAEGDLAALEPRILLRTRFKGPDPPGAAPEDRPGREPFTDLTVTFRGDRLDGIDAFQRDIFQHQQVELDLDRIESKKNFAVVTKLGASLIGALVLFAALAITLFLYNTLKNHLERIQMNIGTFLAFGIEERFLRNGYTRIVLELVLRTAALAMGTLLVMQGVLALMRGTGAGTSGLLAHVDVLGNAWPYLALLLILATCFLIARAQLRRFLSRPPGDLIYART